MFYRLFDIRLTGIDNLKSIKI